MVRLPTRPADLERAAEALRAGMCVAYPTETSYGLGVDPWHPTALDHLLARKGRDVDSPLPLVLADRGQLERVVKQVPAAARHLMDKAWPGPLTLVLPARSGLPAPLVGPLGVGVRISSHPVATALARLLGAPLVATSANHRGAPPAMSADQVARDLGWVDLLLDAGEAPPSAPSTVVSVAAGGEVRLLRQGALKLGEEVLSGRP